MMLTSTELCLLIVTMFGRLRTRTASQIVDETPAGGWPEADTMHAYLAAVRGCTAWVDGSTVVAKTTDAKHGSTARELLDGAATAAGAPLGDIVELAPGTFRYTF